MNAILKWFSIVIILLVATPGCRSQNGNEKPLTDRPVYAAGRFYSSNPDELRNTLRELFEKAKPRSVENVVAIIAPHAGYDFSGGVAASAYNQVDPEKKYDNVFIIASSHQASFEGASIYNQGDYVTPLGKVKVNLELANKLIKEHPEFTFNPNADKNEHSCEVQVPFLQYHLKKNFRLIPIIIGTQSPQMCKKIADALRPYFNENSLFIISSDFSHYPGYSDAKTVDNETCKAITSNSADQLLKILQSHEVQNINNLATSLCGWTSVLTFMEITRDHKNYQYTAIEYKNSGDSKYPDKSRVVGYWAIAVSEKEGKASSTNDFDLSPEDKKELLRIARSTITQYVRDHKTPDFNAAGYSRLLLTPSGAFVTLKEKGELRGCIGRFTADESLYKVVREMAIASATQDTRFEPVSVKEIDQLEIEISVLSPMKRIHNPDEIILGKHGIYIKQGYLTGTFLPQVATETGWTKEEFLGHCARDKAGIGWNGWKNAELYIYTADVFSEKDFNARKD
jgi:MEMO1 family protein